MTRPTSSAGTSPTSIGRCSPWSTCPKWSRGPCSPGTPVRPRACAGCSSTSSWGSWTSAGDATVDATVGLTRAEELYEKVFFEYGDDSVAQLGGVHLACEQASNVLTKVLEWGRLMAYLEQSTRYIAYNQRLTTGHYRYYRDPGLLDSPLGARYVGDMDRMFDTYGELLEEAKAWLAGPPPPPARRLRLRPPPGGPGQGPRRPARAPARPPRCPTSASTARASPTRCCSSGCGPIRFPRPVSTPS